MNAESHAERMDDVYRGQKHIYDASRKFFLLGRDRLIRELQPDTSATVLELGCGTGRNLLHVGRRYPTTQLYGVDISMEMLGLAQKSLYRGGCEANLARADASCFDPQELFGRANFDRVFVSYALSMIPPWKRTIAHALQLLAPGGSLHIVDFGQQEHLPDLARKGLFSWLRRFHVTPHETLFDIVQEKARAHGAIATCQPLYRGYAWHAVVQMS
ncbi:MAG: class I SAM-dependent methyltransferase [Pseudomonadota bacterium]